MSEFKANEMKMQLLMDKIDTALQMTADALKTDIIDKQVTPKETGNLEGSARAEKESENNYYLEYTTPYAEKLYTHPELNFRQDKNPHAEGEWLKAWITGDDASVGDRRDWLQRTFAKLLAEQIGGDDGDD